MMMVTMMTKAKFSFQCHSSDGFQPDVAQDGSLTRYRIEGFFVKKKLFTQIDTDTDTNRGIFLCEKNFSHRLQYKQRAFFVRKKLFTQIARERTVWSQARVHSVPHRRLQSEP